MGFASVGSYSSEVLSLKFFSQAEVYSFLFIITIVPSLSAISITTQSLLARQWSALRKIIPALFLTGFKPFLNSWLERFEKPRKNLWTSLLNFIRIPKCIFFKFNYVRSNNHHHFFQQTLGFRYQGFQKNTLSFCDDGQIERIL